MKRIVAGLGRLLHPVRLLKYTLLSLVILVLCLGVFALWILSDLPDVTPLKNPRLTLTIEVRDWQGGSHPFLVGPNNPDWAALETIPAELKWAVIAAEDASFYRHEGIDVVALKEALKHDLKRKRFERGASTITQQLAKNLFLTRDKSLVRKLRELVLARRMEEALTKGRILELYLNVVELGPLVYGVGSGARYHFNSPVAYLTPAESAFLAAILPGPRVAFNPRTKADKVRKRAAHLLELLGERRVLSAEEIASAQNALQRLGGEPQVEIEGLPDIEGADWPDADKTEEPTVLPELWGTEGAPAEAPKADGM